MGAALLADGLADVADALGSVTVQLQSGGRVAGAGVVWHRDGLILSNAHVVPGTTVLVLLAGDRRVEGRVLARDPRMDLAALFAPAAGLPDPLPTERPALKVGEVVVALGHPFGISNALSLGIVHRVPDAKNEQPDWIRSTIRLAPGNSGGPLADTAGRLLGLNTLVAAGIGHSIPVWVIQRFLRRAGLRLTDQRVA